MCSSVVIHSILERAEFALSVNAPIFFEFILNLGCGCNAIGLVSLLSSCGLFLGWLSARFPASLDLFGAILHSVLAGLLLTFVHLKRERNFTVGQVLSLHVRSAQIGNGKTATLISVFTGEL